MSQVFRYVIISTVVAILIAAGSSILPRVHASMCGGLEPTGLICVTPPGPYKLQVGNWNAHVGDANGILNISSVNIMGNVQGTLFTGNATNSVNSTTMAICTAAHPCQIAGSFDTKSGRISFTSHPTIPTFVAVIQNYTGYLSSRVVGVDVIDYTIDGIGSTVKPVAGKGFGWDASISCILINGPCSGGSK